MKQRTVIVILTLLLVSAVLPTGIMAQVDSLGSVDTVFAKVAKLSPDSWSVTLTTTNDDGIVGVSLPMKIDAGLTKIVADSMKPGEAVANWDFKSFRVDTAIQCFTIGLIANLKPGQKRMLKPGTNTLATVYISSLDKKPIEKLKIDTTTTHPNNSLMMVADPVQGTPPDTVRISPLAGKIYPAFVVKMSTSKEE
ncbi:MAG: hypothetical protein PVH24_03345 [Candidatus Zixiibacteriota bacterium]|jgi:hypothetical protein